MYIGDRADLNSIIILADNNGMNDQYGFLNLGVNDFRTEESLVFRDEEYIETFPTYPKLLQNDIPYYPFGFGKEKFPFESPNPLKSYSNMWTMIGISPLEVYNEIEKIGFVFPK